VNSNAAAYTRAKHKALVETASVIAIHVESLIPEVYDSLMAPLHFENVIQKIEQILDDFPGKVRVSVPVSQHNVEEFPNICRYFIERGAQTVNADPFISRCAEDRTLFERLAIAPVKHWCEKDAMDQLVVDCDGVVLLCCNDFERREPIGDLSKETLSEMLQNERHQRMERLFDERRLCELPTCNACYMSYSSFHRV
jgi:radical SAM protein with 4Fe4S-binding SPASM domain